MMCVALCHNQLVAVNQCSWASPSTCLSGYLMAGQYTFMASICFMATMLLDFNWTVRNTT